MHINLRFYTMQLQEVSMQMYAQDSFIFFLASVVYNCVPLVILYSSAEINYILAVLTHSLQRWSREVMVYMWHSRVNICVQRLIYPRARKSSEFVEIPNAMETRDPRLPGEK